MANVVIQLRRGKQATWEEKNPVLAYGEPGYVKETGELKIGDGITHWKDLNEINDGVILYKEQELSDAQKAQARANIGAAAIGEGGGGTGENGATFTPSVSEDGVLSWSNDKGLANPASVNIKGETGTPGKDGASITITDAVESTEDGGNNIITFSDGTTLIIKNGSSGAQGEAGKDGISINGAEINANGNLVISFSNGQSNELGNVIGAKGEQGIQGEQGETGADGYTPVKGVDYWTGTDQESIVQQVIMALGTPVFGRVDANNNIILTGDLTKGTYTLKYEDDEGKVIEIGTIDIDSDTIRNLILIATDADGNAYNNGQGWKTGYRLNSSGTETTASEIEVTGFMEVTNTDTIYFSNISWPYTGTNNAQCYFALYDDSYGVITSMQMKNLGNSKDSDSGVTFNSDDNLIEINLPKLMHYYQLTNNNAAYFRISAEIIDSNSIITVNQPIN